MVSGVSSRPPWSTPGPRPTIASTTSVDNSAPVPRPGLPGADARVPGPDPSSFQPRRRPRLRPAPTPAESARSSLNPRARTSGRRARGLSDVLAGRGASRHARRRPTMRDDRWGRGRRNLSRRRPDRPRRSPRPIPPRPAPPAHPGGLRRAVTAGPPAPQRPQRPRASHPGDALGRPRNNPPDEEDPPEQTATNDLHAPRLQNHP